MTAIDNVNRFIYNENSYLFALRTNAQNHFDNSVRTMTESLRGFMISANRAAYVMIGENRTILQKCIVDNRDALEDALNVLKKTANSPIFDYSLSTESQIELDLKPQTDEVIAAITASTDMKCLTAVGITTASIDAKYTKYSSSITSCVYAQQSASNSQIVAEFNPEHFPLLTMLNNAGYTLGIARTRDQLMTFVSNFIQLQQSSDH